MSLSKMLQPPLLKLRFLRSPPPILFTNSSIVAEDGSPIEMELFDSVTDARVTMGSPSSSRLEIVALNADFDEENWTTEKFNQKILRSREGELPLLVGDSTVTLKEGVGEIGDITFTSNSKWLRSNKFRLGVKAIEGGIMEAISEAFECQDLPEGSYRKHYPQYPYPDKIPKNSFAEFCLWQAGIHTVKDLRSQLSINSITLPRVSFLTSIIEYRSRRSKIFDINWRKYGQKEVQGGTYPRSYSMCTNPGCSATKKVERSPDGQVTETILGGHNQKCFRNTKRGNRDSTAILSGISIHNTSYNSKASQFQTSSSNKTKRVQQEATRLGTTTEHMSEASDSEEVNNGETGKDEDEPDGPDPKRRRHAQIHEFGEPEAVPSDKSIREGRVIVQTTSEVDVSDDAYSWRKYGKTNDAAYGKHYPPYPDSLVWRLENIAKGGLIDRILWQAGIHTVRDLRRYLSINPNFVPRELKERIAKNTWNSIVSHSMLCVLDESEYYVYNSERNGASLLLNSVYEVMRVSFDGIIVLNTIDLTSKQKVLLDNLKREAYENTISFIAINSADFSSFLLRSSKNLKSTESSIDFPGPQSIFVDGASSVTSDAFEPQSTSVTLSASKYHDVVIRYGRGDISNYDFISHLHAALCRRGISVYENFDEADSVPECSVLIILLTSTYVPSNLLNILEHQQTGNLVVYPIFYRLSPNELIRNIKNYERFFLQDELKRWQASLKKITQMSGYTLTNKSESELIDEIVRDALKVLCSGDKVNMIGMDIQADEISKLLCIESQDVRSIGIWGMVGIGKTAIAEEIFRRVSVQYETCVFLKDFHKEVKEKGHDAVREEFLSTVLEVEPHVVRISDIKTSFLRSRLQHKRVLVIIDDVNDYKDVDTVLGKLNYFGPGSRIIMCSRNRHVFVLSKTNYIYEVKPLDITDSLLLFDRGTFHIGLSPEVYRTLSLEVVKFSNGNPQVLQFLSKTDREWNSLSEEIQKKLPMYIPEIFEKSCCGLDDNERCIFLDIACFFNRMDKENVAMLLDGCGYSADVGFRILVDKSLLDISQHNMVNMLSFIQATGREIVHQESPDRPGDRSRLWNAEDIRDVFLDDTGTSAIEGIFLDMSNLKYDANPNLFEKMCNLRLLKLYFSKMEEKHGVSFPQGLEYLPRKLRLLHWEYYPLSSLPKSFNPENLVELNLSGSCAEKLWKGKKSLGKLKKMILSYSYQLTKIPRLSNAPNLEHIDLEGCHSLLSITQSISYLKNLVFLNLKDCSKLESIPSTVDLESLEILNFSGCLKLENFPEISPNVKELYMGGTMVQEIPSSIKNLVFLEILDLENSKHLKNLPTSICKLKHLETLNLSGCIRLDQFPDLSRRMKCLKFIDLSRTAIKEELPSSISYLTALEELRFVNCSIVILPIGIAILVMSRGYIVLNKDVAVGDGIKGVLKPPIEIQRGSWNFLGHFAPKSELVKRPSSSSFNNGCDEEESREEEVGLEEMEGRFLWSADQACSFTGSIISCWKKGQLLGRGSFGSVYEGITRDGHIYAVKEVSLLVLGSQAQECIQQLEGEIVLLSQLQHPNIVQYHGTDKDESNLYIFLELVTQGSLLKLYQRFQFVDSVISVYTRQILGGLKYLHDNGVIHRDIKCANILVDASGAIKLADFGLGKVSKLKDIKLCKGTPFCMAPEVINSRRNGGFGRPADIWSVGCTVLEMLTRQIPYSHLEPIQVLFRIGRGTLPEIPDTLTQDARHFIHSCLKVKPEERPTADELLKHPFVTRPLPSSVSGSGSASLPDIYNAKDWEELLTRKKVL